MMRPFGRSTRGPRCVLMLFSVCTGRLDFLSHENDLTRSRSATSMSLRASSHEMRVRLYEWYIYVVMLVTSALCWGPVCEN